jgi:hypothetical protein
MMTMYAMVALSLEITLFVSLISTTHVTLTMNSIPSCLSQQFQVPGIFYSLKQQKLPASLLHSVLSEATTLGFPGLFQD